MNILNPFLELHIDLNKIATNFQKLQKISGKETSAVIKADAYGVGAVPVAKSLFNAGCRKFYVATIDEALKIRDVLPFDAQIYIFNCFIESHLPLIFEKKLIPVFTTVDQIQLYKKHGGQSYILHFDTGMKRLSLPADSVLDVLNIIPASSVEWVMSHLASADDFTGPQNKQQLELFKSIIKHFPRSKYSLIASKGINLPADYHFDQVRPGIYLYGVTPSPETAISKTLDLALSMRAQILETKMIQSGESVGYNATYVAPSPRRIATIAVGYADGIPIGYSNKNHFWIRNHPVPIIGRVSMDLTIIDITGIPESMVQVGEWVDLIQDPMSFYEMSKAAGSSPHEMLTRLGQRCKRVYKL
ncbi:MAG: alanine racemase [Alphaproteobacteria bacterium]